MNVLITGHKVIGLFLAMAITLLSVTVIGAENIRFERLSDKHGLSQMSVNAVLQDRQGFIWFGTQDGLNRYDGYQFKVYRHDRNDPYSLSNNWINTLYEDSLGELWIGTNKGVHRFERETERFIRFEHDQNKTNSLSGDTVFTIAEDHDGMLWFGCLRGGLTRYDPKQNLFSRFYHDPEDPTSLASNSVVNLLVDSQNTLWISAFGGGLNRFEPAKEQFIHYRHQADDNNSISSDRVVGLFEDRQQRLWVGTRSGLDLIDKAQGSVIRFELKSKLKPDSGQVFVWDIVADQQNNLWLSSGSDGLYRFDLDTKQYSQFVHDPLDSNSISSNRVRDITQDRSGIIWISTRTGGVNKYNPAIAAFSHYQAKADEPDGLRDNTIWALHQGADGTIWIGGRFPGISGLEPYSNSYRHHVANKAEHGFDATEVIVIEVDKAGMLWLSMKDVGLVSFDPQTGEYQRYGELFNILGGEDRIGAIMEDRANNLWLGTDNGLIKLDSSRTQVKHYVHQPDLAGSLIDNKIMSLYQANDGSIWVGTQQHGLARLDLLTGKFESYSHDPDNANSLSSNIVDGMVQTADEILWIATQQGLNRLDLNGNEFRHYGRYHGLSNETIFGLMVDDNNLLWLTTNDGLNRFDPVTETFSVYRVGDGIAHNEFSSGAYHITDGGQIYIGGINGFNGFNPNQIKNDGVAPDMVFTDFLLNNQPAAISTAQQPTPLKRNINHVHAIELKHTDLMFSFEFSALHFADPEHNHYAYQLEGFDRDWVFTDSRHRRAIYTNLDAGNYSFKIKGSNKDNIWSEGERSIQVKILPAPWLTWWAYSIYVSLVVMVIASLAYLRFKKREIERQIAMTLEASEKQLSLALWGSGDQLWDWDREACLLIRRNQLEGFDLEPEQPVTDLIDMALALHPDDQLAFQSALSAHLIDKVSHFECAYRLKDKTGKWRWVLNRAKVVEADERGVKRMSGTLQDIHVMRSTEKKLRELNSTLEHKVQERTQELQGSLDQLKAAQQQLVEAEKMAALGNLVSGVAHEVNTPLGICITMVSLHLERLSKLRLQVEQGTMTRKSLDIYLQETEDTQKITDGNLHRAAELIQSFKKVAVDQSEDTFDQIVFHDYLQDIIRSIEPTLTDRDFSLGLLTSAQWQIKTYPGAWWLVVSSLVENSLTHGFADKQQGQMTIEAHLDNDLLRLVYRDDGCGMDDDALDKIYEPFFTTARHKGQTGLGMHIVYNTVVQKLGGDISCQSSPGAGVEFIIEVSVTLD